jgi:hypothetical protein
VRRCRGREGGREGGRERTQGEETDRGAAFDTLSIVVGVIGPPVCLLLYVAGEKGREGRREGGKEKRGR